MLMLNIRSLPSFKRFQSASLLLIHGIEKDELLTLDIVNNRIMRYPDMAAQENPLSSNCLKPLLDLNPEGDQKPWTPPKLIIFGQLGHLTRAGIPGGSNDFFELQPHTSF